MDARKVGGLMLMTRRMFHTRPARRMASSYSCRNRPVACLAGMVLIQAMTSTSLAEALSDRKVKRIAEEVVQPVRTRKLFRSGNGGQANSGRHSFEEASPGDSEAHLRSSARTVGPPKVKTSEVQRDTSSEVHAALGAR